MIQSRRMRWAGQIAHMGEKSNAYRILVGKSGRKSSQGRRTRRWKDNIKIDLRKIGCTGFIWHRIATRDRKSVV
jgi:hypothetical protein